MKVNNVDRLSRQYKAATGRVKLSSEEVGFLITIGNRFNEVEKRFEEITERLEQCEKFLYQLQKTN